MFKNTSWSRGFLRLWIVYAVIAGIITLGFILGDNVDPKIAFFAGLAVGSWFWGKRAGKHRNQLRIYAGLEVGVAITALLYFVVIKSYHVIYPALFQSVHSDAWLLLIKFLLALVLIFPPAFCMGGTIPVIGQHAIRNPSQFGSTSALLYGINTLGATLGALLAGFFMPLWFGFQATCFIAIGITIIENRHAAGDLAVNRILGPAGCHIQIVP